MARLHKVKLVSRPRSTAILQDFTSRLPCEIVREIFSFVIPPACGPSNRLEYPPRPAWIPVFHVCRRWREIAVRYQRMWSTISTSQFNLFTLALEQSGSLPLTIYFMRHGPSYISPRRSDGFPSIPDRVFDLLALQALPRTMRLLPHVASAHHPHTLQAHTIVSEILPDDIFEAKTPRLHTLRLNIVDIHPSSSFLNERLRTLELKDVRCYRPIMPDLAHHDPEALLEALRRTPYLEELSIISPVSDEVVFERTVEEGTHAPPVPLGNLRKLILEDYAFNLPGFIRRLELTETCGVALRT
ncbi:hypothetical protein OF83DRAFT_1089791, partial [Amylostereum chailletii]